MKFNTEICLEFDIIVVSIISTDHYSTVYLPLFVRLLKDCVKTLYKILVLCVAGILFVVRFQKSAFLGHTD